MSVFGIMFLGAVISAALVYIAEEISRKYGIALSAVCLFLLFVSVSLLLFVHGQWIEMFDKYNNFEQQLAHVIEVPLIGEKKIGVIVDVVYSDGRLSSESLVGMVNNTVCRR